MAEWFDRRDNLWALLAWAASEGYSADELVRMAEKPWKWHAEFVIASCRSSDQRERSHVSSSN